MFNMIKAKYREFKEEHPNALLYAAGVILILIILQF